MEWIRALPWWSRWAALAGSGLASSCLGVVSDNLQWAGLVVGCVLIVFSGVGLIQHFFPGKKKGHLKPMRQRMRAIEKVLEDGTPRSAEQIGLCLETSGLPTTGNYAMTLLLLMRGEGTVKEEGSWWLLSGSDFPVAPQPAAPPVEDPKIKEMEKALQPILKERREALKAKAVSVLQAKLVPMPEPGAKWSSVRLDATAHNIDRGAHVTLPLTMEGIEVPQDDRGGRSSIMSNAMYCTLQPEDADRWADGESKQRWHAHNEAVRSFIRRIERA